MFNVGRVLVLNIPLASNGNSGGVSGPAATVSMSTKFGTCAASFIPSHATGAAADSSS